MQPDNEAKTHDASMNVALKISYMIPHAIPPRPRLAVVFFLICLQFLRSSATGGVPTCSIAVGEVFCVVT